MLGKRMEDHLRFAVCFWHTFCWPGSDVFGAGTFGRPWHAGPKTRRGRAKREAAFDFVEKLDVPFYCFHDVDVMADAATPRRAPRNFAEAVDHLEEAGGERPQAAVGHRQPVQPSALHGRRRDQSRPRSLCLGGDAGARLPRRDQRLGGANYVLWGGREGYDTILNTELARAGNLGRFLAWSSITSTGSASRARS